MKKLYQKIIVSILSLVIMGTVCATAPVMADEAEETATAAKMFIDNEYLAWLTNGTNAPANGIKTAGIVEMSQGMSILGVKPNSTYTSQKYFKLEHGNLSTSNRPAIYRFKNSEDNLIVTLPEKKTGYDLHTVGIVTSHWSNTSGVPYEQPFDYMYSTDKATWNSVTDVSYTGSYVSQLDTSYAYYEVLTVPADAKYIKIVRNNKEVTIGTATSNAAYPGVMGFSFGYVPTTNNDVLKVTASKDTEIIDLMTTGMVQAGNNNFVIKRRYQADGVEQYGLTVDSSNEMVFNALDGYKITAVEADSFNDNDNRRSISIKLGNATDKQDAGSTSLEKISVTSEAGEDSFSITCAHGSPGALYNISITMEKIKAPTEIAVAIDGTTATATVSNLGSAAYDSMELIVAGYAGDRFMGAQTKTVTKADEDGTDSLTVALPTGTKTVKVFLWKDLDTLVPVLEPVELPVPDASAE